MIVTPELQQALLASIPALRASAVSLCGQPDQADDLVQQALVKAWDHMETFEPGTNMAAWLYTIMRNEFYTEFRKRRREVQDADGKYSGGMSAGPSQDHHMQVRDVQSALLRLRADQREALLLVGAWGMSYEEAAEVCRCAVGTMKSRVNRARGRLAELLTAPAPAPASQEQRVDAPLGQSG